MKINEIFYSLQGEGKWMGFPNIFIRTMGCNLRCSYCDTTYAYEQGREMGIESILSKISSFSCNKICLTGGEPLLQEDVYQLLPALVQKGYSICLETNGSLSISDVCTYKNLMISLDIKCPSSKMHKKMDIENISRLRPDDQLKCIIKNKKDYHYAKALLSNFKLPCPIFFQPVWGTNPLPLIEWILKDNLPVQLGLQLHKIIFGDKPGI